MTGIIEPIFIIGPGRSGTTLTLRMMALHPDLAWFSGWTDRFPYYPQLALLSRLNDLQFLERSTRNIPKWPRPAEAYGIWNYCFTGFSIGQNDWNDKTANAEEKEKLTRLIKGHLQWQGKKRFITKYTGWPRIKFLKTLLPDAKFIYVERDPRAVVFSYMKQKWGYKKNVDVLEAMPIQDRLDLYSQRYMAYYMAKQLYVEEKDYHQLFYEKLVAHPLETFEKICVSLNLEWRISFRREIANWPIQSDTNTAWQKGLSVEMQRYLSLLLAKPLQEMGYTSHTV